MKTKIIKKLIATVCAAAMATSAAAMPVGAVNSQEIARAQNELNDLNNKLDDLNNKLKELETEKLRISKSKDIKSIKLKIKDYNSKIDIAKKRIEFLKELKKLEKEVDLFYKWNQKLPGSFSYDKVITHKTILPDCEKLKENFKSVEKARGIILNMKQAIEEMQKFKKEHENKKSIESKLKTKNKKGKDKKTPEFLKNDGCGKEEFPIENNSNKVDEIEINNSSLGNMKELANKSVNVVGILEDLRKGKTTNESIENANRGEEFPIENNSNNSNDSNKVDEIDRNNSPLDNMNELANKSVNIIENSKKEKETVEDKKTNESTENVNRGEEEFSIENNSNNSNDSNNILDINNSILEKFENMHKSKNVFDNWDEDNDSNKVNEIDSNNSFSEKPENMDKLKNVSDNLDEDIVNYKGKEDEDSLISSAHKPIDGENFDNVENQKTKTISEKDESDKSSNNKVSSPSKMITTIRRLKKLSELHKIKVDPSLDLTNMYGNKPQIESKRDEAKGNITNSVYKKKKILKKSNSKLEKPSTSTDSSEKEIVEDTNNTAIYIKKIVKSNNSKLEKPSTPTNSSEKKIIIRPIEFSKKIVEDINNTAIYKEKIVETNDGYSFRKSEIITIPIESSKKTKIGENNTNKINSESKIVEILIKLKKNNSVNPQKIPAIPIEFSTKKIVEDTNNTAIYKRQIEESNGEYSFHRPEIITRQIEFSKKKIGENNTNKINSESKILEIPINLKKNNSVNPQEIITIPIEFSKLEKTREKRIDIPTLRKDTQSNIKLKGLIDKIILD